MRLFTVRRGSNRANVEDLASYSDSEMQSKLVTDCADDELNGPWLT